MGGITLFPDQEQSINSVVQEMQAGNKSVLLQGATGTGKSYIASKIIERAICKGKRVIFSVPRRYLIRQMSQTFNRFGFSYSYIASGLSFNPAARAYIASTDTLKRRLDEIAPPDLAIIDETHYGGKGLERVIDWLGDNASYIIGLSATPWRLNGVGLGNWYNSMVCGPSIRWLIENKRLAEYKAYAPDTVDLSQIKKSGGDYAKNQLCERMEQDRVLVGNAVSHYKKHASGMRGVTFAVSIKHSQILAQSYRDAGIRAVHVDGDTPESERFKIFRSLAKREIDQVTSAELLTFGFDIASAANIDDVTIECITDCQPTKSLAKQMQKWGRALRFDDSPHYIFDHANNIQQHGLPCAERDWTLSDWKSKRRAGNERTMPVKLCDKCHFTHHPSPKCPNCGYVYPADPRKIEEIEGELKEIQIEREKRQRRMEVGMAKSIDELKEIREERGYSAAWVWKMAKIKGIKG